MSVKTIRLRLRVLSPLHIGAGEQSLLTPLDYVVLDKEVRIVNHVALVEEIARRRLFESYLDYLRRESHPSIEDFLHRKRLIQDHGLLQACTSYSLGINTPGGVLNRRRIRLTMKAPDGKIYIPGSEFKGSLRTSLIFGVLSSDRVLREKIENDLLNSMSGRSVKISGSYIERLLRLNNTPNTDFMRLVRVSDMHPVDGVRTEVRALLLLRTYPHFDERLLELIEVIPEEAVFEGTITLLTHRDVATSVKWAERLERLEEELAEFIMIRTRRILEENLKKLRALSNGRVKFLVDFYEELRRLVEKEPVMPIGYGQGFWGTTVSLLFPTLVRQMLRRKIIRGRALMEEQFPRTLKVVASAENAMPLGWCSVEFRR